MTYDYNASAVGALQAQTGYTWSAVAFGTPDVPQSVRDSIVSRVRAKFDDLSSSNQLSDEDYNVGVQALANGAVMFPGLTSQAGADAMAKVAYYAMMDRTGLRALKQDVLQQLKKSAADAGYAAAQATAFWDTTYSVCNVVSGHAAIEKMQEYIAKIQGAVNESRAAMDEARRSLPDDQYQALAASAKPINDQLSYLEKWVPGITSESGGGLAAVQAAAVIVVAVVIGVLALVWTIVEARKNELVDNARKAIDEQVARGEMTAEQGAAAKQKIYEAAASKGFLGIDLKWVAIGGVAVLGVMLLPSILALFPKRAAAASPNRRR